MLPVFAYNFGSVQVAGTLTVTAPQGWLVDLPSQVTLAPGERKELGLRLNCPMGSSAQVDKLKVTGDFGAAGKTVLSVQLIPSP